jgi:NitT/TauT family transport system ATP-binding protein
MKTILSLKNIYKSFKQRNHDVAILEDISLEIREKEIIGVIGRSGSGKSTLLRVIAQLIPPSAGSIVYHEKSPLRSAPKMSMIFQTFGLIPWLNVLDNVTLGLEELDLSKEEIENKALKAIQMVGLSGYEEAYPKEISGGMRQRVGFARAMVVDPEILLMDEPFSSLDHLTSNSLKKDLLELWADKSLASIKAIIMVTHSIEEATKLCDRVVILSSNPGKIIADIAINLAHPRDDTSVEFHQILDKIYKALTSTNQVPKSDQDLRKQYPQAVSVVNLFHFMFTMNEMSADKKSDVKKLSAKLKLNNEQLLSYIDSLLLLGFADMQDNIVKLSAAGRNLITLDDEKQKEIFRDHLLKNVPFVSNINNILLKDPETSISKKYLIDILEEKFNRNQAIQILNATISWGRYADLFSYNNIKAELHLN